MESIIDKPIISFIKKHHVFTLATENQGQPWCASCFYAWHEERQVFIFTTEDTTRHGAEALNNSKVAGNIVLETRVIGNIQGLQMSGITIPADGDTIEIARQRYLKRFPYARLIDLHMWIFIPHVLKLTDNRLGFGKKLIWKREA